MNKKYTMLFVLDFHSRVEKITVSSYLLVYLALLPRLNGPSHPQKLYCTPTLVCTMFQQLFGAACKHLHYNLGVLSPAFKLWLNFQVGCHTHGCVVKFVIQLVGLHPPLPLPDPLNMQTTLKKTLSSPKKTYLCPHNDWLYVI
jgi:hypothetical protein